MVVNSSADPNPNHNYSLKERLFFEWEHLLTHAQAQSSQTHSCGVGGAVAGG